MTGSKRISDRQLAAGVQFSFAVLQSDKHIILTQTDFIKDKQLINMHGNQISNDLNYYYLKNTVFIRFSDF